MALHSTLNKSQSPRDGLQCMHDLPATSTPRTHAQTWPLLPFLIHLALVRHPCCRPALPAGLRSGPLLPGTLPSDVHMAHSPTSFRLSLSCHLLGEA